MAEQVNIHAAKTRFSQLVERVEAGEEIIIARSGRPVAKLVGLEMRTQPREPGRWAGKVTLAADFDVTPTELIDAFES